MLDDLKHVDRCLVKKSSEPWILRRLWRFRGDADGGVAVIFALTATILLGAIGLATDVGFWESAHRKMQDAADSAAVSAVVGFQAGVNITTQADAVAASYNFVNGMSSSTVTANRPPLSGSQVNNNNAVEVIISQPQARLFSAVFGGAPVNESARAVAIQTSNFCILALDQTVYGAITAQGSSSLSANGCTIYSDSNNSGSVSAGGSATISAQQIGAVGGFYGQSSMTATNGFFNSNIVPDPYAYVAPPVCGSNQTYKKNDTTIQPGTYNGGFTLNSGANVTMAPGVYCINGGSLTVNGSATLNGAGVTIYFTGSNNNWATAKFAGGASVNLTAPTGTPPGVVLFGDRNMPVGTSFNLIGGNTQTLSGVVYLPQAQMAFSGNSSSFNGCTQIISDTIQVYGSSGLAVNCQSYGASKIGPAAQLVE